MSVNSYLSDLAVSLQLTTSEKSSINTSINAIQYRLDAYFTTITEKKVFGSYVRGTILPRKVDSNSDIDIMVVFSNPSYLKPQSFLNKLKCFAENFYSTSEIHQSSPTIVLKLNHIKFELTPAYKHNGCYYIPNGPSTWTSTDPEWFYSNLTECNVNNGYKIKPIIRLLKYWNIEKNNRNLESYFIEKTIAFDMKYANYSCKTYPEYLKRALTAITTSSSNTAIYSAIRHIDKALEYENNNMPYLALDEIQKVFPEVC